METSGTPQPRTEQRAKDEIKRDLDNWELQAEQLNARGKVLADTVPEDKLKSLDEAIREIEEGNSKLEDAQAKFTGDLEADKVFAFYDEYRSLGRRKDELRAEYRPFLLEEVKDLARDISSRMDFAAFMKYVGTKQAFNRKADDGEIVANIVDEFFFLRRTEVGILTGSIDASDSGRLDHVKYTLEKYAQKWETKGFLKPNGDADFSFRPEYGKKVAERRSKLLRLGIKPVLNVLTEYQRLSEICRYQEASTSVLDFPLEQLAIALRDERGINSEGFDEIDLDPRLIGAAWEWVFTKKDELILAGKIKQYGQAWTDYLEKARDVDVKAVVEGLNFHGLLEKEGVLLAVKPEGLKNSLKALIPPYFLQGITDIFFAGQPIKMPGSQWETQGFHWAVLNGEGKWIASKIGILNPIHVEPNASPELILYTEFAALSNLVHEVAHKVHYNLTLDEMEEWDEIRKLDPTFVTTYAKDAQRQSLGSGWREDFAESFKLFFLNPALLEVVSPERYNYIYRMLYKYTKDDERGGYLQTLGTIYHINRETWKKNGLSDSQVRQTYLAPIEAYEGT